MYHFWILFLSFIYTIFGYPDGAPERACFYMTPRHTHPHTGRPCLTQTGPAPYRITVSNTTFRSNTAIRVTISGAPFKGFFIVAAEEGNKDWPTGIFYADDPYKARTIWCAEKNDAATHSNDKWKDTVTLMWYGPTFTSADMVTFVATVVTNRTTYWTNIKGPMMTQGQVQEGGVGEGGGSIFGLQGNDPWGYPTTASWMNSRVGGQGFSGGSNRLSGGSGGFDRFAGVTTGGEGVTRTPSGEGAPAWGETRGGAFGAGRAGGARGGGMNNSFMRLIKNLFGMKK